MRLIVLCIVLMTASIASAEDELELALRRIYSDYLAAVSARDIGRLVILDQELRFRAHEPWEQSRTLLSAKYFKQEYRQCGLEIGHYSDALQYSGKLLVEAHRLNPHSSYRQYTFYSTICRDDECQGGLPDIDSAYAYLREFPEGPFVFHTTRLLARFHSDLYQALRDRLENKIKQEVFEFFSPFMSTKASESELLSVQQKGLTYYKQAMELRPADKVLAAEAEDLQEGICAGWFLLPD
jgi:hypothetical protein